MGINNKTQKENLQNLLKNLDANSRPRTIMSTFRSIAKELFNNYHIQKGDQEYYFMNLEFYFFNKCHQDIITYPRDYSEGKWFFHPSGVDLTFNGFILSKDTSNINVNTDYFGGILIREIVKKSDIYKPFKGPHVCEWELFDAFDALSSTTSIPYIERNENDLGFSDDDIRIARSKRYFTYKGDKVDNKYKELNPIFNGIKITSRQFEGFLNAKHAYRVNYDDLKKKLLSI